MEIESLEQKLQASLSERISRKAAFKKVLFYSSTAAFIAGGLDYWRLLGLDEQAKQAAQALSPEPNPDDLKLANDVWQTKHDQVSSLADQGQFSEIHTATDPQQLQAVDAASQVRADEARYQNELQRQENMRFSGLEWHVGPVTWGVAGFCLMANGMHSTIEWLEYRFPKLFN